MKKFVIKLSRIQRIKNLFNRTMVQQKPKVENNKKKYNRYDKSYKEYME